MVATALLTWFQGAAPFVSMITVECLEVGMMIVSKAAMTKGMSNFVFVVYWNSVAAVVFLPFAVFRRKRAPICLPLLCRFVLLSLIGSVGQMCAFGGLKYSSPTLSAAISNLIPLFSFLLAIMMRMEKLDLKTSAGVAISLGAIVSVLGATIATLYQGPKIFMSSYHSDFHHLHSQQSNWAFGGFLLAVTSFMAAIWYIYMMILITEFPEKLTIVFFFCFFNAIITGVFSLFMERNPNAWKLRADIELIAIFYAGIIGVIRNAVHSWCLEGNGVTYTVMFKPLGIVVSIVLSVAFLGETLHTGSLAGGIVIALGFYSVMWGKEKDRGMILNPGVDGVESSSGKAPLLKDNHDEQV